MPIAEPDASSDPSTGRPPVGLAAVLEAFPASAALLESTRAVVVAANEPWRRFHAEHGFDGDGVAPGSSYLAVCDRLRDADGGGASLSAGLRAVLAGEREAFECEYEIAAGERGRWYLLVVRRVVDADFDGAIVLNVEVTERHEEVERQHRTQLELERRVSERTADLSRANVLLEYEIGERRRAAAERNQLLDEVRLERRLLAAVLDQMPLGVMIAEAPSGRVVLHNEQLVRLVGRPLRSSGSPLLASGGQAFHADGRPYRESDDPLVRALRGESVHVEEMELVRPDGEAVILRASAVPVRDEPGDIIAAVVTYTDVTEWKTAERQLRASETRYRLASRAIKDAIWDWDVLSDRIDWSDGITSRFGHPAESVQPSIEWWLSQIHGDERQRVGDGLRAAIAGDSDIWQDEYRFCCRDGRWADVVDRGFIVRDASGRAIRAVGAMEDISDRRRAEAERAALLERERRARAEAEAANRAKDEFLAVVSHELRTPLAPILGFVEILREDQLPPAEARAALNTIERNARSLSHLIEDLLDVSRITSGKLSLEYAALHLHEIVAAVVDSARPAATAKGVALDLRLDADRDVVGRRRAPHAGGREPGVQRGQVHAERRHRQRRRRAARESCRAARPRHRQGHHAGAAAARLRALPPGRHVGHARARRARPRARDRPPHRRPARRRGHRRERRRGARCDVHGGPAADAGEHALSAGVSRRGGASTSRGRGHRAANLLEGRMRRRALATTILLLALCVLGFLLRTTNAATVFVGDAVVPAENDPYYHLRRIFLILADYPRVPSFDPWIDHPSGAPVVFAPLFDFGVATLAWIAGFGANDRHAVETLAALLPPLLGALTCVAVYCVGLRTTSRAGALLGALLVTLTPAHVWYSRLGFVDHHVLVTLLHVATCALVLSATGILPGVAVPPTPRAFGWRAALATLAVAAGVLSWNGYLLLVAVLDAALLLPFACGDATLRTRIARLASLMHLGAALLVLPVVALVVRDTGAPWSTVTLSYLHPALLAAFGAVAGAAAWATARGHGGRALLAASAVGLAVAAIGLALERDHAAGVLRWLSASDPFMGAVQESVSIVFTSDGRLDLHEPQIWMTRFFVAAPLLLVVLALRLLRGSFGDHGRSFLLAWSAVLFAASLAQRRFGETAAPALALLAGDALAEAARTARDALRARGVASRAASTLAALGVALLVAIAIAPYYAGFVAQPRRLTAILRAPEPVRDEQDASADVRLHRTFERFGALLRDPSASPGAPSAAMNPWPLGHKLLHVAGTPVTTTPFGSYVGGTGFEDAVDFYLATDERHALDVLARRGSRWVVVDDDLGTIGASIVGRGENPRDWYGKEPLPDGGVAYAFRPPLLRSMYHRLTRLAGSEARIVLAGDGELTVPALDHLRLMVDAARDDASGFAKVYEVVPGAVLVVRTAPRAEVVARYAWRSDAGRERIYEKSARADDAGDARIVLPYSSERADVGHTSRWSITSGGRTIERMVAEAEVRGGRELSVTFE